MIEDGYVVCIECDDCGVIVIVDFVGEVVGICVWFGDLLMVLVGMVGLLIGW